MKWGQIQEVEHGDRLLYWALMFVLQPYFDDAIDHWLKDILKDDGGLSGDPGWSIEQIPEHACFRIWADPEMSGIEPAEAIYGAEEVREAIRNTLCALSVAYPEKSEEASEVMKRYGL
jgi:hypothetical protein